MEIYLTLKILYNLETASAAQKKMRQEKTFKHEAAWKVFAY